MRSRGLSITMSQGLAALLLMAGAVKAGDDLTQARALAKDGKLRAAIRLLERPGLDDREDALMLRAELLRRAGWHERAEADLTRLLEKHPDRADLRDARGSERFFLGRSGAAMEDFDESLRLEPARTAEHWRRGIACLHAGRFEDGRRQFELYQGVDGNDVENVVWWHLCAARTMSREEASRRMPKVGHDRRVPLMEVDQLFRGRSTPAAVLTAADLMSPKLANAERASRAFYAHLYLGLWHESTGDATAARQHFEAASVRHYLPGYMGDVARVHLAGLGRRPPVQPATKASNPTVRFQKEIDAFLAADRNQPAGDESILFVGSSTIRLWPLERQFADLKPVNRGFGGSTARDALFHARALLALRQPKTLVWYEGDNDLDSGRTPEQVRDDTAAFVKLVHQQSPKTRIILLGIKPSIRRWSLLEVQRKTNTLLAQFAKTDPRLTLLDLEDELLGENGRPDTSGYADDGLHLSEEAYRRWSARLRPLLTSASP